MEQLELFPLNEWTKTELNLPPVTYIDRNGWYVGTDCMGTLLSFNDGTKKWVYKLSHVEEKPL